jgi:hypothetical protein
MGIIFSETEKIGISVVLACIACVCLGICIGFNISKTTIDSNKVITPTYEINTKNVNGIITTDTLYTYTTD